MKSLATLGNELYSGKTSLPIVPKRRLWYTIALTVVLLSAVLLGTVGLNPGIDFKGGTEITVTGLSTQDETIATDVLTELDLESGSSVTEMGSSSVRIQTNSLDAEQTAQLSEELAAAYGVTTTEISATTIGPTWSGDVTSKAVRGLLLFFVLVGALIWVYFRTWRMALAAMIALVHDVVITVGIYAMTGFEVTPATVIGVLTILGYSLYDTVVVFDKIRENTHEFQAQTRATYGELANLAVNQTLVRSINTSVVGVLPVASLLLIGSFILGAGTLRDISLTLFIGMIAGTVSSILLATPILVDLRAREESVKDQENRVLQARESRKANNNEDEQGELVGPAIVAPLKSGHRNSNAAQPKRKKKK